jgi:hypothetical protein
MSRIRGRVWLVALNRPFVKKTKKRAWFELTSWRNSSADKAGCGHRQTVAKGPSAILGIPLTAGHQ